jgi:hypothetical protein
MLTFSSNQLYKTRDFKALPLNQALKDPISLEGKKPPISYYPFSEDDPEAYIAIHVIRALLSIALKNIKGGPDVFDESVISADDIIAHNFNHVWNALSVQHRERLKEKIRNVIRQIMLKEGMKEALSLVQQKQGIKIERDLDKFRKEAMNLIDELQSQSRITDFPKS